MDHNGRRSLYNGGYDSMAALSYHRNYSAVDMDEDSRHYREDASSVSSLSPTSYDSVRNPYAGSYSDAYEYAEASGSTRSRAQPSYHHHRLPETDQWSSMRKEYGDSLHSLVGQEGMPSPARRPQRPRIRFTPEEDQLLIELKEQKNLTWKQIADFFPGRNSGTLQVRYCTKLRAETMPWTREMDQRLLEALQSYEDEKWRIVAQRVGSGVTPMGCCDRVWELFNIQVDDASPFTFANDN
ncbi:hypothetical protein GGI43DRAFT_211022 [Trichoderma evansii]